MKEKKDYSLPGFCHEAQTGISDEKIMKNIGMDKDEIPWLE